MEPKKIKKVTRYNIRYYPNSLSYSKNVGKGKLHERNHALRLVRRLKRSGIDAFCVPMIISK